MAERRKRSKKEVEEIKEKRVAEQKPVVKKEKLIQNLAEAYRRETIFVRAKSMTDAQYVIGKYLESQDELDGKPISRPAGYEFHILKFLAREY